MITGAVSGISAQVSGPANVSATTEAGAIFDSLLAGMIKGQEAPTPGMQEETPASPELNDKEESADPEIMEPGYPAFFPFRIIRDGNASAFGSNVPEAEQADPAGTWQVSMADKQLVITDRLASAEPEVVPAAQTVAFPEETGDSPQPERSLVAEMTTNDAATASKPQTFAPPAAPASMESRETVKKERALPAADADKPDETLTAFAERPATAIAEPAVETAEAPERLQPSATSFQQATTEGEEKAEQPEVSLNTPISTASKAQLNQGMGIHDLPAERAYGKAPSKVTASHIESIHKTIEMQIEKTPVSGNTVVKILLTPDNIGDIHVQLIKTKDSVTAVLQVKDAETKGLLEEQLPQLMEPFKQGISEGPVTIKVVADASLGFSFSEGSDQSKRRTERQESRKRAEKEKPTTKEKAMQKKSLNGLSLLA